jgi:hypothetical protein
MGRLDGRSSLELAHGQSEPMTWRRSLLPYLGGLLALLTVGCDRRPDSESDYRGVASRIAGSWRLLREDQFPFVGHPPCLETLSIDMDSPSTASAVVTFCGGSPSEQSRGVTVEIADEPFHPDPTARECRMTWDSGSTSPREMHVRWSEAVYSARGDGPAFYAEDVLTVEFSGSWLADQPNAQGAIVDYARETSAAAANYSPR